MRLLILCFLLFAALLPASAQTHAYFSLHASTGFSSIHVNELNNFIHSYNEQQYLPPYFMLMREYSRLQPTAGTEADISICRYIEDQKWGPFYNSGFSYQHMGIRRFTNGIIPYHQQLRIKDLSWLNDIGLQHNEKFFLGACLALNVRKGLLSSYYVYTDNSTDLGSQYPYLGNFSAQLTDLKIGPSIGLRLNRFLHIQTRFLIPLNLSASSNNQIGFRDPLRSPDYLGSFPQTFPQALNNNQMVHRNSLQAASFTFSMGVVIGAGKNANRKIEDVNREENQKIQDEKNKAGIEPTEPDMPHVVKHKKR